MIQTAHFWKIFSHGHQSCQNTSENKKTAKLRSFKSQGTSDGAFTNSTSYVGEIEWILSWRYQERYKH